MKKNALCLLALLAIVPCFAREANAKLAEAEKLARVTPEMVARAAQFREAIETGKGTYRSGVYIFETRAATAYNDRPVELAARIALLGFTEVYLGRRPTSEEWTKWVEQFIETASRFGVKVKCMTLSSLFLLTQDFRIYDNINMVKNYNASVPAGKRFAGISADLEPHTAKEGRKLPDDLTWRWGKEGPGNDNDLMLKRTVDVMKVARQELGDDMMLSEAVNYGFQERVDDGRTLHGGTAEFLQHCDQVIVMAYNKDRDRIWAMSEPSLKSASAAKKPASVSICVKTSLNNDGGGARTSLLPAGWDAMIADIKFTMEKGKTYDSFRGVDVFEYQGFDTMWDGSAYTQTQP